MALNESASQAPDINTAGARLEYAAGVIAFRRRLSEQNHAANRGEAARLRDTEVIGQAIFCGCLAVINVGRQPLERSMPPSLRLPARRDGQVPCLLLFGEQTEATTCFGGIPMPWSIRYHELMFAVPFVRREGTDTEHLYVHRMVCDFWPAVWVGNNYYGFNKSFAQMRWDNRRFAVTDVSNALMFSAEVSPSESASGQGLTFIQRAAGLPVIGRREDGRIVGSRFDWLFPANAIDPVALKLTVTPSFADRDGETFPAHADPQSCDQAYAVSGMRWCLSWPDVTL